MWVYDEDTGINYREVTYVPGLYKIFEEILGKYILNTKMCWSDVRSIIPTKKQLAKVRQSAGIQEVEFLETVL